MLPIYIIDEILRKEREENAHRELLIECPELENPNGPTQRPEDENRKKDR